MTKSKLAIRIVLVVGCLYAAAWLLFLRDTPERVASKVDRCVQDANAACAWAYIPKDEKKTMSVSQQQFARLLKEYVAPTLNSLGEPKSRTLKPSIIPGSYELKRDYTSGDGEPRTISLIAVPGPDGPVVPGLLSGLVTQTMSLRHPRLKSDALTYDQELRGLRADSEFLDSLGFKGFIATDSLGTYFFTWQERIKQCEAKIADLQRRLKSSNS